MSGVKVGDRVRATCGENVIVGTVTWLDENDLEVDTGDAFGIGVRHCADDDAFPAGSTDPVANFDGAHGVPSLLVVSTWWIIASASR